LKWVGWIASVFALTGQILMIFKNPWAFVAWSLGEGLLLIVSYKRKQWGEVMFFTVYVVTNLIALYVWSGE
jgi:hypothetical protein